MSSIIIGLIAWWIAEGCGIPQTIKWWLKIKRIWYNTNVVCNIKMAQERRIKPLDCPLCMGWWIGLIYTYSQTGSILHSFVIGVLSSCVAIVISKLMKRL